MLGLPLESLLYVILCVNKLQRVFYLQGLCNSFILILICIGRRIYSKVTPTLRFYIDNEVAKLSCKYKLLVCHCHMHNESTQ